MLILDENLPADQRLWLRKWRIHFRIIGVDLAAAGTKDENLLPVLHRLPSSTLFTLDRDFFRVERGHSRYGLVWLDVRRREAAEFIRRFLRHQDFNTNAKRMGIVARVHGSGVQFWRIDSCGWQGVRWPGK